MSVNSDPAGGQISADERVERIADAQVSDEYPHRRDPEREPVHDNIDRPRWCPVGLTRSQKRRVQRVRQTEVLEEERKEAPWRGVKSEVDVSSQGLMISMGLRRPML